MKAFRDTWRDGIHSYLTYLRDRLTVARDLLTDSGSVFVQIGDENVHRVREVMEEVFGEDNYVVTLKFSKTAGLGGSHLDETFDYIVWYARAKSGMKFRRPFLKRTPGGAGATQYRYVMEDGRAREVHDLRKIDDETRLFSHDNLTSQTGNNTTIFAFELNGHTVPAPRKGGWKSNKPGIERLARANRIIRFGSTPRYVRYFDDAPYFPLGSAWLDTNISGFGDDKVYVVQTLRKVVERCILMTTDPGDLVLDPTCGSGTTAYVAEQWGRRWITIDTSRVALALARARVMGARYPYYLLADSLGGGRRKPNYRARHRPRARLGARSVKASSTSVCRTSPSSPSPTTPRSTSSSTTTKPRWNRCARSSTRPSNRSGRSGRFRATRKPSGQRMPSGFMPSGGRGASNGSGRSTPPSPPRRTTNTSTTAPSRTRSASAWPARSPWRACHPTASWMRKRNSRTRTASPRQGAVYQVTGGEKRDFAAIILDNLRTAGVQQAHKEDRIAFTALTPWPGDAVCAEGRYPEGDEETGSERRAGIFVGPEFGTVSRPDLVDAAREAAEAGFDVLIACAFNFDAGASEFAKLGALSVLKARMNADLHMAEDLKTPARATCSSSSANRTSPWRKRRAANCACASTAWTCTTPAPATSAATTPTASPAGSWTRTTTARAFFVRHAYFLGANATDPYKSLKTTLKAEIDADAWNTLYSDVSRPFEKPMSGRIAVKVINHLGTR